MENYAIEEDSSFKSA